MGTEIQSGTNEYNVKNRITLCCLSLGMAGGVAAIVNFLIAV